MNYQHSYHAGNIGDLLKHLGLVELLLHLRKKEKGFFLLDSHAGIGLYDLLGPEALATGEAAGGAAQLAQDSTADTGEALQKLQQIITAMQQGNPTDSLLRWYPGSPLLASALMRPQDRLLLVEKNPQEFAKLERFSQRLPYLLPPLNLPKIGLRCADGYATIKAELPPAERRGALLIDPAYEIPDEVTSITRAANQALQRWPQAAILIWLPIKQAGPHQTLLSWAQQLAAPCCWLALCDPAISAQRRHPDGRISHPMQGSALIMINPPWQWRQNMAATLHGAFPQLNIYQGGNTQAKADDPDCPDQFSLLPH